MAHVPHTHLTQRYADAVAYATAIHATQTRKGNTIPYVAHLIGVSSLVLEAGGTEDMAIAALLHDAVEDQGWMPRADDIRARFGDRVAEIVIACSDATDAEYKANTPYRERKAEYLRHLEAVGHKVGGREIVTVSVADKVHNARAIVTELQADGAAVLERFKSSREEMLWYYGEVVRIAELHAMPRELLCPLRTAVTEMKVLAQ
ncbi:MAG: HD domain-containing protein [Actinomycetota bacterium]|nr:HD domain-containing protein [Actinomycetota bacterium]